MAQIQGAPLGAKKYRGKYAEQLALLTWDLRNWMERTRAEGDTLINTDFPEANKFISSDQNPQQFGGLNPKVDDSEWYRGYQLTFGPKQNIYIFLPKATWMNGHQVSSPLVLVVGKVSMEIQNRTVGRLIDHFEKRFQASTKTLRLKDAHSASFRQRL
jgi:hypothetical protein